MAKKVLITGGAGFIGSHLTDALIQEGYFVRVLDNFYAQTHGSEKPDYVNANAEYIEGDVRDASVVVRALDGIDAVIHCAALIGMGQSQYKIRDYTDVNIQGTSVLLEGIVQSGKVSHIMLPASMTSYGEGRYTCQAHGIFRAQPRSVAQLNAKVWEIVCPHCGNECRPLAISTNDHCQNANIYALTKKMQEDMIMATATIHGLSAVGLRLFNVYGPRQSLINGYSGIAAIFLNRLRNNLPPIIYEDGNQTRDLVSVHDVVRAFHAAMNLPEGARQVFNIGSGSQITIAEFAQKLAGILNIDITPKIIGEFRVGDLRHCFADISETVKKLAWEPRVGLDEGLRELCAWSEGRNVADTFNAVHEELLAFARPNGQQAGRARPRS